ncbi:peroxisome membrane protein [Pluteus cervinus]|uniref:Peroxisome membrane protein n=1 Tax=Pluteus cervinus TaxID=181527 RepID=A0ACD3BGX5_9AGAR|nr:peroxisome membrane protein [Pluteus cervinus]
MSSPMAGYEAFLVKNVSTISSIESTLRSLTWFLPGRFKDAELASEALSSLLNMTSMYHDTLLTTFTQNSRPPVPTSLHFRYTQAWLDKDVRYRWIGRVLELIRYTQLVIEMGLKRKVSSKNRWRGIVLLEVVKAVLRLMLLRITKRPLVHPPLPEREFDPSTLPDLDSERTSPHPLFNKSSPSSADSPVEDYLLPKALSTSNVRPPVTLISPLASPQDWVSEVLYTLRPLVYCVLYASDRNTKRPLVAILLLELLSRTLRRAPPPSAILECSEYAHRDRDVFWYLLRGSIWQHFSRPKLEALAHKVGRAPLVGLFGALLEDWIPLIDEYYYYTAP